MVDQNMDEAQFQDMGSAPATIEASRMCIMKGLFKGNTLGQADAMQAYIQARLEGTEPWVEIPEEGWPEEWRKNGPPCERPCMRLIQALYTTQTQERFGKNMPTTSCWNSVSNQLPKAGHPATSTKS